LLFHAKVHFFLKSASLSFRANKKIPSAGELLCIVYFSGTWGYGEPYGPSESTGSGNNNGQYINFGDVTYCEPQSMAPNMKKLKRPVEKFSTGLFLSAPKRATKRNHWSKLFFSKIKIKSKGKNHGLFAVGFGVNCIRSWCRRVHKLLVIICINRILSTYIDVYHW